MKKICFVFIGITLFFDSCKTNNLNLKIDDVKLITPFETSHIKVPNFINTEEFSILSFGAMVIKKNRFANFTRT